MAVASEQKMIELITRDGNGQLIRVRQINDPMRERYTNGVPFTDAIMVQYTGSAESLVDILQDRAKLKEDNEYYGNQVLKARQDQSRGAYENMHDRVSRLEKTITKKWYQFWK